MFHLIVALLRKNHGRRKCEKEGRAEEEGREENQRRCCIRRDKGTKMTKPENKLVPKMVRKWVPKIAMPAKSIDPK
jgi:hypothetical protein